eukprot:s1478_g1.t3
MSGFSAQITSTGKFIQLLLRKPDGVTFEGGLQPMKCQGQLLLQNVSFAYSGRPEQQVLTSLTLEANPGDVVALVGESGAGKSTLGRLLLRHYDPTMGAILFDGIDYRQLNLRWLRAHIGFVEQEPVLFDRPMRRNIAYGSAANEQLQEVQQAARRANAHGFIAQLPKGYETHPGERAARISGGQKQRVAIARAIIRNPKLLVLDEATSALDSENEHIVQHALDELMEGRTTFVIAHRLSTVIGATKILVLDKGRVIEEGSHAELVANETSRYASFMKHQLVSKNCWLGHQQSLLSPAPVRRRAFHTRLKSGRRNLVHQLQLLRMVKEGGFLAPTCSHRQASPSVVEIRTKVTPAVKETIQRWQLLFASSFLLRAQLEPASPKMLRVYLSSQDLAQPSAVLARCQTWPDTFKYVGSQSNPQRLARLHVATCAMSVVRLQGKWSYRRWGKTALVALLVALSARSVAFLVARPAQKESVDFSQVALEDLLPSLPFESRRALAEREILRPSPIQALALPHIGSGKHAVLISETGSGKTLAYLLPAVQRARMADEVLSESTGPSSVMILTPTRELAVQILSEVEDHCQGIIALVTLSARASWYTLMDASVIIGTPTDILEVFDDEDAEEVKDLLGRVEVVILDELDELLPKQKFTGRKLARYQDPGMWPAEGLLKRLMRNNARESLQLVAASATAYLSSRLRLERVMQRDKLKRFPVPLPKLDPQRTTAAVVEAAAVALRDVEPGEVERHIPQKKSSYHALPAGIQHYTWKVPLSGSHAAAVAAALDVLRPESVLIFVCPNAGESVKGVVKDLTTAGWSNVDTLSRALFPDYPGKKASQVKGEAKGWRSANRLVELRDATKRGYSQEGDFYREAPIFVSAEESVRGLHLDAVEVVFILGLPKTSSSYVHMVSLGRGYPGGKA